MINKRNNQFGLTMIELMVAMVMGAILILGVAQTFVAHKKSHSLQAGMSRVQEGGRMAMAMMSRDVRMADYWGCAKNGVNLTNNIAFNSSAPADVAKYDFLTSGAGGISGTDVTAATTIEGRSLVVGSDTVTLRGSAVTSCTVTGANHPSATISISGCRLENNAVVAVSNCLAGDIFMNTAATDATSLGHSISGTSPANGAGDNAGTHCTGNSSCLSQVYDAGAQILMPYSVTYFIADSPSTLEPGLYRFDSISNSTNELVDGVESMQISYAVDLDYDSSATIVDLEAPSRSVHAYKTATEIDADATLNWDQVIGMKVDVLLRSDDGATEESTSHSFGGQSYGGSDYRMRKQFTTMMNIRNRSMPSAEGL
jgi:type IV pilus assembly protein PilW